MRNALTFDLEDYFQVSAYSDRVNTDDWKSFSSRLTENTDRILELLAQHDCAATFFVLGWVAETQPEVVVRIASHGHEIACHSHFHRRVSEMTPDEFREDTRRAKCVLEDVTGKVVVGYRAPSFSLTSHSNWAFEILAELGFSYDSSVFPIKHPSYGMPKAPRTPYVVSTSSGPIVEFPMPTLEIAGKRSPLAGGAYLRLLPYWYTRWGIRYLNDTERHPVCVYLHPWEIDTSQPTLQGRLTSRFRHRIGLGSMEAKLRRLLKDFEFCPLGLLIDSMISSSRIPTALDPSQNELSGRVHGV